MSHMEIWDKVKRPPESSLKTINAGRLRGMTDISPQWRYQVLTEVFGMCGIGWKYEIKRLWTESGSENQVMAFAEVSLFVNHDGKWSEPVPGIGGSLLIAKEKNGLHTSDEAFKMAVTDALSVATKMLGVAADIYAGKWDGSKYKDDVDEHEKPQSLSEKRFKEIESDINSAKTLDQLNKIWNAAFEECKAVGDVFSKNAIKQKLADKKAIINEMEDIPQ